MARPIKYENRNTTPRHILDKLLRITFELGQLEEEVNQKQGKSHKTTVRLKATVNKVQEMIEYLQFEAEID